MAVELYSDRDLAEMNRRVRAMWVRLGIVLAALLAALAAGLALRVSWLAYAAAALLFIAACFGVTFFLLPNIRYRSFLVELGEGLARELRGSVAAISDTPELQDGARVLPVRILLADGDDERIVYLNVSKRDLFPAVGTPVRLNLYGRHIRAVATG